MNKVKVITIIYASKLSFAIRQINNKIKKTLIFLIKSYKMFVTVFIF